VTKKWARAALSHPAFCGVSRTHLGYLTEELADPMVARCESALDEPGGTERQREAGAGPRCDLVFTDRLLVTLAHLRTGLPRAAPAELYGPARSTISRAIGEIRPLWRRVASPSLTCPRCGCAPSPTCSPTRKSRGSRCGSTEPRPRSVEPRPTGPGGEPSSPARRRRGLPGLGQRVPHPGQRPAEEAEGRVAAR
jgi:Helix-turn-helix of DDE superfamily endonuclease